MKKRWISLSLVLAVLLPAGQALADCSFIGPLPPPPPPIGFRPCADAVKPPAGGKGGAKRSAVDKARNTVTRIVQTVRR